MRVEDPFTPESIEAFRRLTEKAMGPGQALMEQYRAESTGRGRTKGTFLIIAARCPVCGKPVCLDRSVYQSN